MKLTVLLYLILLFLGLLLVVDQCSTINIRSAEVFKSKQLDRYQFPSDGLSSANYTLEKINDNYYGPISYSPTLNKFFIYSHPTFFVFDSNGNILHQLQIPNDGHPIQGAPYAETDSLFFDLTRDNVQPITLKIIWRKDYPNFANWKEMFASYYNQANTVVYSRYGRDSNNKSARRAFLNINNEWICVILHDRMILKNDYRTLITTEPFPAKAERLQYLVDTKNKSASTHTKEKTAALKQRSSNLTELDETYSKQKGAKIVFFEKTMVYSEIVYTSLPNSLGGTAYYKLTVDNDVFQFKEHSYRGITSWKARNFASLYTVPKQYEDQLKAKFLVLQYPSNFNESGAAGMYVIKPK